MVSRRLVRSGVAAADLDALASRPVNFAEPAPDALDEAHGWHVDELRQRLPPEPAGPPVPGGSWEIARKLVTDYQFAEPRILRAVYWSGQPLLGRDMLLQGRFYGLRFHMGVRVTSVLDTTRGDGADEVRVWGWSYSTLRGHLEEGELTYEVVKRLRTGDVEFVIHGYSRRGEIPNPLIHLGFRLFGRWVQVRFYRRSARRLDRLVRESLAGRIAMSPEVTADGLVLAPADARVRAAERLAPRSSHPGAD
jgi:uncharacterized protein (UPF0548 family)